MKFTNFCSLFVINGHYYFLNTLNSALIELDKTHFNLIKKALKSNNLDILDRETKKVLFDNGFLIDDNVNEFLFVRNKYLSSKYRTSKNLKIDIAVTDKCNFKCVYCFENFTGNKVVRYITQEIKNIFISNFKKYLFYMIKHEGAESLEVVWYGGEPSLDWDFIFQVNHDLMDFANGFGIRYENIIITNGFLMDDKIAKKLSVQHVKYIQVTLDGPKKIITKGAS